MSASHAAEMIVHHTQSASYMQGRAGAYAEAMRLVRTAKQQASNLPMAEVLAMLERTETTLYDLARESEARMDKHNRVLREVDATLSEASRTIPTRS